jgi:hypothetical protein
MNDPSTRELQHRRHGLPAALACCGIAIAIGWIWISRANTSAPVSSQASLTPQQPAMPVMPPAVRSVESLIPSTSPDNVPDSSLATPPPPVDFARLLGQWTDEFYGERTLTFRDDGTGTMHLKLDPVSRLLYGDEVSFEFAWTLTGDDLHFIMTGGEPAQTAESLSRLFGKTSDKRIELLDEQVMHLRSLDSGKLYVHRRK